LASCGFDAPTDQMYTPGVGVNVRTGTVDVLHAAIVSDTDGSGTVIAALVNNDQDDPDRLVEVAGAEDDASITVTVSRNTRVKWLWRGEAPHNVNVSRGPVKFKSKTMTEGSYSRLMTRAGTYRIYCTIHGREDQSMVLKVR